MCVYIYMYVCILYIHLNLYIHLCACYYVSDHRVNRWVWWVMGFYYLIKWIHVYPTHLGPNPKPAG